MAALLPAYVLFDLDGTLVDSAPDLTVAINIMLDDLGLSKVSGAQVRNWIGNGATKLIQRALAGDFQGEVDSDLFERGKPLFYSAYGEHLAGSSVLYPDCERLLSYLSEVGVPMGCVTNKPRQFTLPLLDALTLTQYFKSVVCADDVENKKPAPDALNRALQEIGCESTHGYMVGDSASDLKAAQGAGIRAIYMRYGYNQGANIEEYHPIEMDSLSDLLEFFQQL